MRIAQGSTALQGEDGQLFLVNMVLEPLGGLISVLCNEASFGAEGHVATPKLTSARRRGPGLWDMWRRRSPPL
jgi:E3 ubiquitin-protein ligase SIAH1